MNPSQGASPEGTLKFQKDHKKNVHPSKWRTLGEWSVSSIALGTYLGNYDEQTDSLYKDACKLAISKGCNFFDTAINYRCQRSERLLGEVFKELIASKKLNRNQFVVSTKGGFIPFDSKPVTNMSAYIKENWVDPGTVSLEDIVSNSHCMHPNYLQTQIDQSLKNLQLETIDLYYLHNPETQLPVVGPDEFYKRLKKVFELFEKNVSHGKIQIYGLATWTAFREPVEAKEYISLEKTLKIAEEVGGQNHHFKAIQLPYNMAMLEALGVASQKVEEKNYPIFPASGAYGVSVTTSAPLLQSQLLHLPNSLTKKFPDNLTLAQKEIQFVVSTPGVTSAMVGMKGVDHVEENMEVMKVENWDLSTLQQVCDLLVNR